MYEERFTVTNAEGLHARPAAKLVEVAGRFQSTIEIVYKDKAFNAKSILSIMGAGIYSGAEVALRIEGADEEEAAAAVGAYMANLPD